MAYFHDFQVIDRNIQFLFNGNDFLSFVQHPSVKAGQKTDGMDSGPFIIHHNKAADTFKDIVEKMGSHLHLNQ